MLGLVNIEEKARKCLIFVCGFLTNNDDACFALFKSRANHVNREVED